MSSGIIQQYLFPVHVFLKASKIQLGFGTVTVTHLTTHALRATCVRSKVASQVTLTPENYGRARHAAERHETRDTRPR